MPTKHRRHAITETGAVAEALAQLRAAVGPNGFTLSELVVLGAQRRIFEHALQDAARRRRRALLVERIRSGTLSSVTGEEFDQLRRSMWVRGSDD